MHRFLLIGGLLLGIGFNQTADAVTASNQDRARSFLEDSLEDSLKDKNPDTRKHAVQALRPGQRAGAISFRARSDAG
jgi:hypothetical protein